MATSVKIALPALDTFRDVFSSDMRFKANSHIRDMLDQWRELVSQFLIQRYFSYSFGGGDWAPLAASTLRQKKAKGQLLEILRRTDLLFESFAAEFNKPSGTKEWGIRIEFGGGTGVSYPGETITPGEVGMMHQEGGDNLPQRKIIVPPNDETIAAMRQVVKNTLVELYHANT